MYYKITKSIKDIYWQNDVLEVIFCDDEKVKFNCVKEYEYNMILSAKNFDTELRRITSRKPFRICNP